MRWFEQQDAKRSFSWKSIALLVATALVVAQCQWIAFAGDDEEAAEDTAIVTVADDQTSEPVPVEDDEASEPVADEPAEQDEVDAVQEDESATVEDEIATSEDEGLQPQTIEEQQALPTLLEAGAITFDNQVFGTGRATVTLAHSDEAGTIGEPIASSATATSLPGEPLVAEEGAEPDKTQWYVLYVSDAEGVEADQARYLVKVAQTDEGVSITQVTLMLDGASYDVDQDDVVFYNNAAGTDAFLTGSGDTTHEASEQTIKVTPEAQVSLAGDRALIAHEFSFQLVDADGTVLQTVSNEASGTIAFDAIVVDEPGTFTIKQVVGNDDAIVYDEAAVTMAVTAEGAATYEKAGQQVSAASFANEQRPIVFQVKNTSATTGKVVAGSTYGLYLLNGDTGNDAFVAKGTSDKEGLITFADTVVSLDTWYCLKESAAGAYHVANPYRSAAFKVVKKGERYQLVFEDGDVAGEVEGGIIVMSVDDAGTTTKDGALVMSLSTEDQATTLQINKVSTRTYDPIAGAKLAIVNDATGKQVTTWTSGTVGKVLTGVLDTGVTYRLTELAPADKFDKAGDVTFHLNDLGEVVLDAGADGEIVSAQELNYYGAGSTIEQTVKEKNVTVNEVEADEGSDQAQGQKQSQIPAKTFDDAPVFLLGLIALMALAVFVVVAIRRR